MKLFYAVCIGAVLFAACADRDPLSSTADPSSAGKATISSDPTPGLPEPRVAAQFTVRIENLGTVLAPGAWVAQRGGTPFFTDGQPDRGAGLEALAEDGNPAELAASLHPNSGVFTTPEGADGPGPLTPGSAYEFTFVARPGDRLSFATMYVQSNDLFLAPGDTGIALFADDGLPISGDITDQIALWDAGTEVNEEPGVGANQAPRQAAANTGADEGGTVRLVDDGFTYPAVADIVSVTVTSRGGLYIRTVDDGNMDGDTSDGQTGLDIAITPDILSLTNALISYFRNVLLIALTSDEVTINGAGGGTLAIAGNEWVLTDYSSDGLLVLNGILNVGEDQFPLIPLTGNIATSGTTDATVLLDLVVDMSGDEPSLSGTVTVGVPYDIGDIIAAGEDGGMGGDGDTDGDGDETDGDMDGDGETDGDMDGDADGDMDGDGDADGDMDGDGETDGDDLPEGPITSARTLSDDPAAGSAEPRTPVQFTVRIENLGTLLAPGVWVAQRGGTPLFVDGRADRGAGLEALAEDGNPAELAASLPRNSGIFNTPVGADSPGPLAFMDMGNAYEFTFVARPGDRLSFATMYVQSNDLFLAPGDTGIALFTNDRQPISGDVTDQIGLWDAGTEVNEQPGVGANQAPRQAGANTGVDEGGVVRLVDDGFTYPAIADIVRITISSSGG